MGLPGLARVAYNLALWPFAWLARLLLRRSPKRWVFAGCGGTRFADNAAWFYLWTAENRPDLHPVWLTRDRAIAAGLRKAGLRAALEWSPRGLAAAARAGIAILSHGPSDLYYPAASGALIANLWHGLPIKHIMNDHPADLAKARPTSLAGRLMQAIQRPGLRRGPDVVYGMTQPGAERVAAAARLRPEQASGAGSPRLQALTAVPPRWPFERDLADLAGLVGQRAGPVVLFLPTWGTDPALRDALLGPELLHWLDRVDGVLIAKPHPNDPPLARAPHWTDRLQVAPRSLDATLLMARADVLVTDISSAMLDMLAAGRPVVLMRLAWTEDRGYYQRPEEFVDGAVVGDGAGFAKALQAAWLLRRKGRGNASKAAAPWLPSDIEASSPQVLADLLKRIPRRPRRLG